MTEQEFNQIYLLHQPTAVQALIQNPDEPTRLKTGMELATQGYQIDVEIMIWGWSAYKVMTQRIAYGYTWTPSALMPPVQMAPGISQPGSIPYDPNSPPPGAIKVSLDPVDYPPFAPPAPPTPPPHTLSLVGPEEGAGSGYFSCRGNTLPDGTTLKDGDPYVDPDSGKKYFFHQSESPFAPNGIVRWFNPAQG